MSRPRLLLVACLVVGLSACGLAPGGGGNGGNRGNDGGNVTDGGNGGGNDGGTVTDGGNGGGGNDGGTVTDGGNGGGGNDGGTVTDGGNGGGGNDGGTVTDGGNGGGGNDGGTPTGWCGEDAPPSTPNLCCNSCTQAGKPCQANGCYNGYWCEASNCRCVPPPGTCPTDGGTGGGNDGGTGGGNDGGTGGTTDGGHGGGGGGIRVLFDDAHGEQAGNADWIVDSHMPIPSPPNPTKGTDWKGAYSSFGVALTLDGDTVETLAAPGTLTYGGSGAQDLSNFQVLVLPEPNDPFSASEMKAIDAFVRAGGGLLAISDHHGADRNNNGYDAVKILNALFATDTWGVQIDPTSNVSGMITLVSSDPLATGPYGNASSLGCWNGANMTAETNVNPSVTVVGNLGGLPFDLRGTLGKGRFVVHGDSSTADDGTATDWTKPAYDAWDETGCTAPGGCQDAAFFQNAVAWVAGAY